MTLRPRRAFAQQGQAASRRKSMPTRAQSMRIRAKGCGYEHKRCGCEQTKGRGYNTKVYQTNPNIRTGAIKNEVPPKKQTQTNPKQTHRNPPQTRANRAQNQTNPTVPPSKPAPDATGWHGQARQRRAPPCLPLCRSFVLPSQSPSPPSLLPDSSFRLHPFPVAPGATEHGINPWRSGVFPCCADSWKVHTGNSARQ